MRSPTLGRRLRHSLKSRGARKLAEDAVRAIKADLAAGMTQRAVARKHGVPPGTISSIASGLSWSWVDLAKPVPHEA